MFSELGALWDEVAASGDMLSCSPTLDSPSRDKSRNIIVSPLTKREDAPPRRLNLQPSAAVPHRRPHEQSSPCTPTSKRSRIGPFVWTNIEGQPATESSNVLPTAHVDHRGATEPVAELDTEAAEDATHGEYDNDTITTECRLKATQQVAMQHGRSTALSWRYDDKDEMSGAFCDGQWFGRDELMSFSTL